MGILPFKHHKAHLVLLSIAALVIISGCTTYGGSGSGSKTLSVETFEPDIRGVDILPGEAVKFTLIVRNTGTEPAKEVKATLIGLDGWTQAGGNCKSGDIISTELSPPRQEFNTPGQSKQCIFVYKAPENLQLDYLYEPKVSISYNYDSLATSRIRLPSRDRFVIKQDAGEPLDSETTFKTSGPIDIDLSTKGEASQVRVLQGRDVYFPLFISVTNQENGFVCQNPSDCSNTLKRLKLDIESGDPSKLRVEQCAGNQEVDLYRGQKGELKCDLAAVGASQLVQEDVVSVTVSSRGYEYTIEQAGQQLKVKREASIKNP